MFPSARRNTKFCFYNISALALFCLFKAKNEDKVLSCLHGLSGLWWWRGQRWLFEITTETLTLGKIIQTVHGNIFKAAVSSWNRQNPVRYFPEQEAWPLTFESCHLLINQPIFILGCVWQHPKMVVWLQDHLQDDVEHWGINSECSLSFYVICNYVNLLASEQAVTWGLSEGTQVGFLPLLCCRCSKATTHQICHVFSQ